MISYKRIFHIFIWILKKSFKKIYEFEKDVKVENFEKIIVLMGMNNIFGHTWLEKIYE